MSKGFSFNYRESLPHMQLLATFAQPRLAGANPPGIDWAEWLSEPPESAITRFQVAGAVRRIPLDELPSFLHSLPVDQLKIILREQNLKVGGSKAELVERLGSAGTELLVLTRYGEQQVDEYLTNRLPSLVESAGAADAERIKRVLLWLLKEGVVIGVVGGAAYDLLKKIAAPDELPPLHADPLGFEWCTIPAGFFLMGSSDRDRLASPDEKPQHRVYLSTYRISKYPITNAQYYRFIQATGHEAPWDWEKGRFPAQKDDHPVVRVSWFDAIEFCKWASYVTGRRIGLPTEAQWEKVARGSDGRIYPWGNHWDEQRLNSGSRTGRSTTPVWKYPSGASPYGVFDMAGNVWEWVNDWYSWEYYKQSPLRNPTGPAGGTWRAVRGGSWFGSNQNTRAAFRGSGSPGGWNIGVGFRVAEHLSDPES